MTKTLLRCCALLSIIATLTVASPTGAAPASSPESPVGLALTDDSNNAQVTRLYFAFFDREPDLEGLNYWLGQIEAGVSLSVAAEQFARLDEFALTYGELDNADFIAQIYQNVLGREGEAEGVAYWLGQLDSSVLTRGEVVLNIANADEFKQHLLARFDDAPLLRLYCAYFLRLPDAEGRTYWKELFANDTPLPTISLSFTAQSEFTNSYGSLDNRQFVERVYRNVQGRVGEQSGVVYWTGELDANRLDRGGVMVQFSESTEYKNRFPTDREACPSNDNVVPPGDPAANNDDLRARPIAELDTTLQTLAVTANDRLEGGVITSAGSNTDADDLRTSEGGTLTIAGNGLSITYKPADDDELVTVDTFTYELCDGATCDDAIVTITIQARTQAQLICEVFLNSPAIDTDLDAAGNQARPEFILFLRSGGCYLPYRNDTTRANRNTPLTIEYSNVTLSINGGVAQPQTAASQAGSEIGFDFTPTFATTPNDGDTIVLTGDVVLKDGVTTLMTNTGFSGTWTWNSAGVPDNQGNIKQWVGVDGDIGTIDLVVDPFD